MKIKIPTELRGVKFPRVCTIEMNDFDIDLFLPALFFTILARGRGRAKITNDPTLIDRYVESLSTHPALSGFDSPDGRRVLDRLVRTTLITTGEVGRSHEGEQITSIVPYSLLSHKPGFPVASRQRGADTFLYQALRDYMGSDQELREMIKTAFGQGIVIGAELELGGRYDGVTKLDTLTRLSLAFLDGFQNVRPGITREKDVPVACPLLAHELAADVDSYLSIYHTLMPVQAFTQYLTVLLNFELFNYTIKLAYAVNALVEDPQKIPAAMQHSWRISPPQIYVDFTGEAGLSQEMARACVRDDLEMWPRFLQANLLLRQLDRYAEKLKRNTRHRALVESYLQPEQSGVDYLRGLLLLRQDDAILHAMNALAQNDEEQIYVEHRDEEESADDEDGEDVLNSEVLHQLNSITDTSEDEIERVVLLLAAGQQSAVNHFVRWYRSVGGMEKPQGILRGKPRSHSSWRYEPTNDLLAVWVQIAVARVASIKSKQGRSVELQPIRLQDFLRFLHDRYGILVDRAPQMYSGAEYSAAAQENLRAMLRRLRQMGIFRDLSDDFTIQRLHPPYAGAESVMEQ
jgi:hypothetical protein